MLYQPEYEAGQGLVEYAMILVLIGTAMIAVLTLMSPTIGNIYSNIISSMAGASSGI